jgi:hypothetical protein
LTLGERLVDISTFALEYKMEQGENKLVPNCPMKGLIWRPAPEKTAASWSD